MKPIHKTLKSLALLSAVTFAGSAANAFTTVYQDDFSSGTVTGGTSNGGANGVYTVTGGSGIGGGLTGYRRQGSQPSIAGGLFNFNHNGNNDRGYVATTDAFSVSGGFVLEVTYTINELVNGGSNRATIGLVEVADLSTTHNNSDFLQNVFSNDNANQSYHGIGVELTTNDGSQGLAFEKPPANGSVISTGQTIGTGTGQTLRLEVDSASNWSYSINGATATTGGPIGGGGDFTRDYRFFAHGQDNTNGLAIDSVTLTVIPEPSAAALLGFGGLALLRRRRK